MSSPESVSLFSLPLAPWQQPQSARTAKYDPRKRRREHADVRENDEEEEEDGDVSDTSGAARNIDDKDDDVSDTSTYSARGPSPTITTALSSIALSPDEAHQYRIAGQPQDRDLPGGHFPHSAPPTDRPNKIAKQYVKKELSALSPPVFLPEPAYRQGSLRLQHLAVITAILHRCILEGDYIRAGRAWGLILRDEFCGHAMDVRNVSRWGIGAEILLWTGTEAFWRRSGNDLSLDQTGPRSAPDGERECFSRAGFEKARSYYERLALQFPFRKSAPDAVNTLDFYPAMFGLWIYVVQEESRLMRAAVRGNMEGYVFDSSNGDHDNLSTSSASVQRERQKGHVSSRARSRELTEAQQIAAQMDELLVSPPFSDSREFLRLRGMVSLWIGDLHVSSAFPETEGSTIGSGEEIDSGLARMELGLAMERKTAEIENAMNFFERAERRMNRRPLSVEGLHIDDTAIT